MPLRTSTLNSWPSTTDTSASSAPHLPRVGDELSPPGRGPGPARACRPSQRRPARLALRRSSSPESCSVGRPSVTGTSWPSLLHVPVWSPKVEVARRPGLDLLQHVDVGADERRLLHRGRQAGRPR
ncbi:MAG: hypothetical protein MZV64_28945 [Ignavibacteriales bacterium]|nr:hypothetical protein [Ignavibacteriales bacterium]